MINLKLVDNIINSTKAGFLIGIGCIANILVGGVTGAFLFSLGLLGVIRFGYHLYTGKIGQVVFGQWSWLGVMLLVNLIAIGFLAILSGVDTSIIASRKMTESFGQALFGSFMCGALMYIGVEGGSPLYTVLAIMTFVLCGFDHCIANYFYLVGSGVYFTWRLPVWILGNSLGSWFLSKIKINKVGKV